MLPILKDGASSVGGGALGIASVTNRLGLCTQGWLGQRAGSDARHLAIGTSQSQSDHLRARYLRVAMAFWG
jgi:hypothetical protein